jgi:hypothetical protein
VERVGERRLDRREDLERLDEQRRLAAPGLAGRAGRADDVAEVDVGDVAAADQLDAPAAVDEVEEDELAHVAPCHDPAGEPARRLGLRAVLERLRLRADRGDLVPVRESLRRAHRAEG